MNALAERPPSAVAAITAAVAVALAILLALYALGFAFAHASLGTRPPTLDAGAG